MPSSPDSYALLHTRRRRYPVLSVWRNSYGDLQTTRPEEFSLDPPSFDAQLSELLARSDATRGVWLRLPWSSAALFPTLHKHGFVPHHYEPATGFVVLQCWVPQAPNPTPPHAHVDVGCGALVVNRHGQLLGIRERFSEDARWGVPGGHLDPGEHLLACGSREAFEETGVSCVALGIVGIHETQLPWSRPPLEQQQQQPPLPLSDAHLGSDEHSLRWGSTHTGVYVLCYALGEGALSPDPGEVTQAAWLGAGQWGSLPPHVQAIVRSAQASGQLAAAAQAATLGCPVPVPGLIAASALPLPSRHGGTHPHVFYHATPPQAFASAAQGAGLGAPQRILCSGTPGAPVPTGTPLARAWGRATASLLPVLGALVVGAGLLGLGLAAGRAQQRR
jgi:hypothetical protein